MNSAPTSLLSTEELSKSYHELKVLRGINLTLMPKSILCLLGPNGAGKTTLLKILAGLANQDTGFIFLNGENVHSQIYRPWVGYCPQTPILWKNLNSLEELKYCADLYGISRKASAERSGYLIERLRLNHLDLTVEKLSGGNQKRLNLALALVHFPKILILDEPTANLDMESKTLVRSLLMELVSDEQISIIYATHDLEDAEIISNEIAIIQDGRLSLLIKKSENNSLEAIRTKLRDFYLQATSTGKVST